MELIEMKRNNTKYGKIEQKFRKNGEVDAFE